MSEGKLVEVVKADDLSALKELLGSGADVNEQDEHGWTPLNWAAGKGNPAAVKLLLENGADASGVGRDQRTPYMIALAAGHAEVAAMLREAGKVSGGNGAAPAARPYCKAVSLKELRQFPGWSESRVDLKEKTGDEAADASASDTSTEDDVVFLHQDFTVTRLMWPGEDVIFERVTPEWKEFCRDVLKFKILDDLDLIVAAQNAGSN
jgi:ankyrin repeat protein